MNGGPGWRAGLVLAWEPERVEAAAAWARRLLVRGAPVALLRVVEPDWFAWDPWAALARRLEEAEDALGPVAESLRAVGHPVTVEALLPPDLDGLPQRVGGSSASLLVLATPTADPRSVAVAQPCLAAGCAVTWPGDAPPTRVRHVLAPFPFDPRHVAPALAGLRDRVAPERITLLRLGGPSPVLLSAEEASAILGFDAIFENAALDASATALRAAVGEYARRHDVDLLVASAGGETLLSADATARLVSLAVRTLPVPVLLVPGPAWARLDAALDTHDLVRVDGPTSLRVEQVDPLGQPHVIADARVAVVSRGATLTTLGVSGGFAVLDVEGLPEILGLAPAGQAGPDVARLETALRILDPADGRLALLDARVVPTWIETLREGGSARRWAAVRLDPATPYATLRTRLEPAGIDALLDASAVLDEGPATDVPLEGAGARLVRVARRLRLRGVPVDLVVHDGPHGRGFLTLTPEEIGGLDPDALEARIADAWQPAPTPETWRALLTEQTGASPTTARRLEVLLDATRAREALLARIAGAAERIHLQVYIFRNDPLGEVLAAALEAAAERGVTVRVLVDSLYSLSGSLGLRNRLLQRLEQHPGITVHRIDPVRRLWVTPIKQRNHRKLLVVDGRIAQVTGRNIGWYYYTGFGEVDLSPDSGQEAVPWLDAGAEIEGAIVRRIDSAFRAAWTGAGGDDFDLADPGDPGTIPCRLVLHDGLADTNTLDTYRTLFDTAEHHVWVLNSFPLVYELSHALLAALERGVDVRYVVGNVRPRYGPGGTQFRGDPVRPLFTDLIHGRVDALVAAGAHVWELGIRDVPGWDPAVFPVRPHVHAKVVSVDGRAFTVGSANLDVSAGYWESEAIVLCEDAELAGRLEARLADLVATSVPIDPADPQWALEAARRAWLSSHWPNLMT